MRSATAKILLLGDVAGPRYYHVGDEAILSARIDWLREHFPQATLVVYSSDSKFTTRIHGCECIVEPALPKKNKRLSYLPWQILVFLYRFAQYGAKFSALLKSWLYSHQIEAILSSDLLLLCGGGNLNSHFSSVIRLRSVISKIAIAAGIPVIVTGQTLGPNLNPTDRALLSSWLPKVHYFGVRDRQSSQKLAQQLGVASQKIYSAVDDAFYLVEKAPTSPRISELLESDEGHPLVGISFYYHWKSFYPKHEYLAILAAMLDSFVEKTTSRLLAIPHTYSASKFSDVRLAKDLRENMKQADSLIVIEDFLLDREIKYVTGKCDYLFSTRYHGVIFALSNNVPCTGIFQNEYTKVKLEGAYSMLDLPANIFSSADRDRDRLMLDHWHKRHQTRTQLSEKLSQQLKVKQHNDTVLKEAITAALS